MAATKSRMTKVALDGLTRAVETADRIRLEEVLKSAAAKQMIADVPRYARLKLASAEKAWAAILAWIWGSTTSPTWTGDVHATHVAACVALLVSDGVVKSFAAMGCSVSASTSTPLIL